MHYSIEPRDRIFVKSYGFLSFARNIGKNLSNKYIQKLDSAKKLRQMQQKLLQREQFKKQQKQFDKI